MKSKKTLTNEKHSTAVFLACWAVYAVAYITRSTYSVSIVVLTGAGLLTKTQAGLISTCFFATYGLGHLINGILADRISPAFMMTCGIAGTVAANVIMALAAPNFTAMLIVWGLNGFLEAMLWAPIVAILSGRISEKKRLPAMKNMSTSKPVGVIAAYLLSSACSYFGLHFTALYYVAAGIGAASLIAFAIVYRRAFTSPDVIDAEPDIKPQGGGRKSGSALALLASAGALIFVVPVIFHGMMNDGLLSWVPTLIRDSYNTSDSFSTLLTVLLPLANIVGAVVANFVIGRFFRQNHASVGVFFMALSMIPTVLFLDPSSMPLAGGVICLVFISLLMTAFNHIFSALVPAEFAPYGKASTASGIINSLIYVGCAVSTYVFGNLSERIGWGATVTLWLALMAASAVILVFAIKPWGKFLKTNTFGK